MEVLALSVNQSDLYVRISWCGCRDPNSGAVDLIATSYDGGVGKSDLCANLTVWM